jgi:rubrerythrin
MGNKPVRGSFDRRGQIPMQKTIEFDDGADYVVFEETGMRGKGQYRCAECGYGIMIHDELPTCPMCSGTVWEPAAWSPFARVRSRTWPEPGATRSA